MQLNTIKRFFTGLAVLFLLGTVSSCKKQLDINYSPNNPSLDQGNPTLVFPAGVIGTMASTGGDLAILGGIWSEYYTQSAIANQYIYIDNYNVKTGDLNNQYSLLYTNGLKNFQYVIDKAQASKDWNFFLMGTVMKAYTTQVLVDLYDKIPYSEALNGANNLNPKFDDGYAIYQSLISSIDTALNKDFSASSNTNLQGSDNEGADLVFKGDISKWKAFANTLKLKLYLRMTNVHNDVAQAGIQKMYTNGAVFLTTNAAVTNFTDAPGKDNPMYEQNVRQLNTPDNLRASRTFVTWLQSSGDPRITKFFGSATPVANNQGDANGSGSAAVFKQAAVDPVVFISTAESYFLQAEARVRYYASANAQTLYNNGVTAAFSDAGGYNAATFIATGGAYAFPVAGTDEQKIEAIIVQKWASCVTGCHGIEAFFERNRTGYPRSSPVYSDQPSYVPGQIVSTPNNVIGANKFPKRLVYPNNEVTTNSSAPALVPITTPVWWSK